MKYYVSGTCGSHFISDNIVNCLIRPCLRVLQGGRLRRCWASRSPWLPHFQLPLRLHQQENWRVRRQGCIFWNLCYSVLLLLLLFFSYIMSWDTTDPFQLWWRLHQAWTLCWGAHCCYSQGPPGLLSLHQNLPVDCGYALTTFIHVSNTISRLSPFYINTHVLILLRHSVQNKGKYPNSWILTFGNFALNQE